MPSAIPDSRIPPRLTHPELSPTANPRQQTGGARIRSDYPGPCRVEQPEASSPRVSQRTILHSRRSSTPTVPSQFSSCSPRQAAPQPRDPHLKSQLEATVYYIRRPLPRRFPPGSTRRPANSVTDESPDRPKRKACRSIDTPSAYWLSYIEPANAGRLRAEAPAGAGSAVAPDDREQTWGRPAVARARRFVFVLSTSELAVTRSGRVHMQCPRGRPAGR